MYKSMKSVKKSSSILLHYITSTHYIVVKHSNFDTHDPQHSKSTINNQILTQSTQVI